MSAIPTATVSWGSTIYNGGVDSALWIGRQIKSAGAALWECSKTIASFAKNIFFTGLSKGQAFAKAGWSVAANHPYIALGGTALAIIAVSIWCFSGNQNGTTSS